MNNLSTPMVQRKRRNRVLRSKVVFSALVTFLMMLCHPAISRAFDIQLMGNFDYLPTSPLQNSSPFGWGGTIRMMWEFRPDWDFTANLGANFFETTQTVPINPVTYYPNNSGLVSITPLSFGIYHVLYRNKAKDWLYALGDIGSAFEYSFGRGRITPEPFAELGVGWSFKQWFLEERLAGVPLAFPAYPGPGFSAGPLIMITTSVGVHFFVF